MQQMRFDYSPALPFLASHELSYMYPYAQLALRTLLSKKGPGAEFTDWLDWPEDYDRDEFDQILKAKEQIQADSQVLVVIGIGGSYIGAKAGLEFLTSSFAEFATLNQSRTQIVFAGNNLSAAYLADLMKLIGDRDFSINVISKSGTTTESSIAFRILKAKLVERYGQEGAYQRIYATTDRQKGALKSEADANGYQTFVIPDGIGGRFTVLTAVGLLPLAVAGADIEQILAGARLMRTACLSEDLQENIAMQYAILRTCFHRKGKTMELLVNYEPRLQALAEWWKQLFGESEGKDHKALFPCSANFSTDLHSLGQIIQDGQRNLIETAVLVDCLSEEIIIPETEDKLDGLAYLEGKSLEEVNRQAQMGTLMAHQDGEVPNMTIYLPQLDEASFGQIIYFFEVAVALSAYMNGVNPFDQPGVEDYKRNMFALLGKPGYEDLSLQLRERLGLKNQ